MHVAIFTSPSVQKGFFVTEAIQAADVIIAADCGARSAVSMGITPSVVLGDFDSLDEDTVSALEAKHVTFIKKPAEKDETDTQLAVLYAIEVGATKITLVGGIDGDRFDHAIANIYLTYNPAMPIYLVNGCGKSWIASGSEVVNVEGEKNDLLSLIAVSSEVAGITTKSLKYPLKNESLYFGIPRGISNVFEDDKVSVEFKQGRLLIIHTKV
jgi:thiamine pyrophosphokinase